MIPISPASTDLTYLICQVAGKFHVVKESYKFTSESSLCHQPDKFGDCMNCGMEYLIFLICQPGVHLFKGLCESFPR